jgi:hypothetical protein
MVDLVVRKPRHSLPQDIVRRNKLAP